MSKAKRHVKKENARKNKKILDIREERQNSKAMMEIIKQQYSIPPPAPEGHPLANSLIRPLTISGGKLQVMTPEIYDQQERDREKHRASIREAQERYPKNADESMEIMLDDCTFTTINVRVFMSIRQFYKLESDEKLRKSLMLEHKDAMMKKETEWLTKMENEKIELGKQIAIRDQMVLEARAETNEYKSMNQSILSQISDKEAKIAQVNLKCFDLFISHFWAKIQNLNRLISGRKPNRSSSNNSNARNNETDGKSQRRNRKGISNKSTSHKL